MALSAILNEGIKYVPALVSAFTQNKKTSAERRQQELLAQQQALISDAYNPDSARFKSQEGIESGLVARDYARSIEELMRAQRRSSGMGRDPLLDNERADEILSRLSNEGMVQAKQVGRQNAQQSILGMANQIGGVASAQGSLIEPQAQRIQNRSSILTNLAQGGVDLIGALKKPAGQTISEIYADTKSGKGGQNPANQQYNQYSQLMVPRYQRGYV